MRKETIDWSKYPKLAEMFEHRPLVNVYWHELRQLARDLVAAEHDEVAPEDTKPIRTVEDFVDVLGSAIEEAKLTNVLGLDDEGKLPDGAHLVALVFSDGSPRLKLAVRSEVSNAG